MVLLDGVKQVIREGKDEHPIRQITIDEEKRLVHLVVTGELDKFEGQQVILETRAKAAETEL